MSNCSNGVKVVSDYKKRLEKLKKIKEEVSVLAEELVGQLHESEETVVSITNLYMNHLSMIREEFRLKSVIDVWESKKFRGILNERVTSDLERETLYFGDKSGRVLSSKASKIYKLLDGTKRAFGQKLDTIQKLFNANRSEGVTEIYFKSGIKDEYGHLTEDGKALIDFDASKDPYYSERVVQILKEVINGTHDKEGSTMETLKHYPHYRLLFENLQQELEHLKELFPEADDETLRIKMLNNMYDVKKLLNMKDNGRATLNFLHGSDRKLASSSELLKAKESFIEVYGELLALEREDVGEIFDALVGENKNLRNTEINAGKTPSPISEVTTLEKLFKQHAGFSSTIESIIHDHLKSPLEIVEDNANKRSQTNEMIRMFGRNPDELIAEISKFITTLGERGEVKGMQISHLEEYREFMKDVFYNNKIEEISDSLTMNILGSLVNVVAAPLMLSASAINHMFDGGYVGLKRAIITGEVFTLDALKPVATATRNASSLLVRIPLAALYELPLGKTYKKFVGEVAKKVDWSTLKNLTPTEHLELLSNIRIATDDFANNIYNMGNGSDPLRGVPQAFRRIANIDVLDKFNYRTIKNVVEKDVNHLLTYLNGGIKDIKKSYKKILKDAGADINDFKFLLHLENDLNGDRYNEENLKLAEERLIPKDYDSSPKKDRQEAVHNYTLKQIAKMFRALNNFNREIKYKDMTKEIEQLNLKGDTEAATRLYNVKEMYTSISRFLKEKGYDNFLKVDDLIFEKDRNGKNIKVRIDDLAPIFENENVPKVQIDGMIENINEKLEQKYAELYRDFTADAIEDFREYPEEYKQYFKEFYAENPEVKEQDLRTIIDDALDNTDRFKTYLQRYYESPLTQASIKRTLSGLDNPYYSINDLLVKSKTMFIGVSSRSVEQFVQGFDIMKHNFTDTKIDRFGNKTNKIDKKAMAKFIGQFAAMSTLISVYFGVLYNLSNMIRGNETDWSPGGVLKLGSKDDLTMSAFNTIINEHDSYASKLMYSLIHGDFSPILKVLSNNSLYGKAILEGTVQSGEF